MAEDRVEGFVRGFLAEGSGREPRSIRPDEPLARFEVLREYVQGTKELEDALGKALHPPRMVTVQDLIEHVRSLPVLAASEPTPSSLLPLVAPVRRRSRLRLDATDRLTIELALGELVGLPLTDMWRYIGFQKFEFGEQRPHLNRKGQETTWADRALVARGDWRIEGPDGFVLSSDHFGTPRTDEHARPFYESLEDDPPTVERVEAREDGELRLAMSKGYLLSIRPWDEEPSDDAGWSEGETWRYMPHDEPRGHLVLDEDGVAWSGTQSD